VAPRLRRVPAVVQCCCLRSLLSSVISSPRRSRDAGADELSYVRSCDAEGYPSVKALKGSTDAELECLCVRVCVCVCVCVLLCVFM
jgi:hypothetical protein